MGLIGSTTAVAVDNSMVSVALPANVFIAALGSYKRRLYTGRSFPGTSGSRENGTFLGWRTVRRAPQPEKLIVIFVLLTFCGYPFENVSLQQKFFFADPRD